MTEENIKQSPLTDEEKKKKKEDFCKNKCPYRDTSHYECAIYGDER